MANVLRLFTEVRPRCQGLQLPACTGTSFSLKLTVRVVHTQCFARQDVCAQAGCLPSALRAASHLLSLTCELLQVVREPALPQDKLDLARQQARLLEGLMPWC